MENDIEKLLLQTEKALQVFYHNHGSGSEREPAHRCLLEIQNSQLAWQLCWKLLDVTKDVETQYFGACMLHHKILKHWKELPDGQYMALKDEIIKVICMYASNTKMVWSKLCVALAAFVLQVNPDFLPNGVEFSVNQLHKSLLSSLDNPDSTNRIVIEYLMVLPEEFTTSAIAGTQRTSTREQLNILIPKVIELQKKVLDSPDSVAVHSASLKCLQSWIQFGASIFDCQNIVSSILNKLNCETLAETASSVLAELLSHPTSFKQENSLFKFLEHLDGLESILKRAIADSDLEMVTNICKILVSIGETHTNLLRQAETDDQQKRCLHLVRLILECTGIKGIYPVDETCSELTFSFWYTFQDELLTLDPQKSTNYHYYLKESFVALVQVLFRKVQMPIDEVYAGFSSDEKEMLRCYRQDIQDTVMYVYSLLREQCLHDLTELLKLLLSGEKPCRWQEIEAVLYLLQGTSEFIESDESTYIQMIISVIPRLPSHPNVLETAVYMIGSFSEWLSCHPEQLGCILPILQNSIYQNQLTTACTLALRDICRESSRSLSQSISLDVVTTCIEAVKSSRLNEKEQIRCIEIIGYILANLSSDLRIEKQTLVTSFLANMLESAIKFTQLDAAAHKLLNHWVNCFAAFFRSSDSGKLYTEDHPLIPCYSEFVRMMALILPNDVTDTLCQDIFNAISKAIDTIRDSFYTVLPPTSMVIFGLFAKIPSGSALEVSATIIGILSHVTKSFEILKTFFDKILTDSIILLESGLAKENPDLIHGFLVFLNRSVKSAPFLLCKSRGMHIRAISVALDALYCQEPPTIKASVNLFVSYITAAASVENKEVTEMLSQFGQDLVFRVLVCIGGVTPRTNLDIFADILMALNRHFITNAASWLKDALNQEGFPTKAVSHSEKLNFQKMLLRDKVNKRKAKEIVRDFSLICRGLHGLPYTT